MDALGPPARRRHLPAELAPRPCHAGVRPEARLRTGRQWLGLPTRASPSHIGTVRGWYPASWREATGCRCLLAKSPHTPCSSLKLALPTQTDRDDGGCPRFFIETSSDLEGILRPGRSGSLSMSLRAAQREKHVGFTAMPGVSKLPFQRPCRRGRRRSPRQVSGTRRAGLAGGVPACVSAKVTRQGGVDASVDARPGEVSCANSKCSLVPHGNGLRVRALRAPLAREAGALLDQAQPGAGA